MKLESIVMVLSKLLPTGILAMLVGVSLSGGAYHIDYDQDGGNPADEWTTPPIIEPLVIICESQGLEDKVNPNVVPLKGIGGLCYASSQDFASCNLTDPTNATCTNDKEKEKEKKPFQNDTHADWGFIEPVCKRIAGVPVPNCSPSAPGYFIRINSNARSCDGAWGQTFAYKESVAYWNGFVLNNETGASGHVTFFVNAPFVEGTYNRAKNNDPNFDINDPEAPGPIENPIKADQDHLDKTLLNCTGNGENWGLMGEAIGKKDP